MSPRITSVHLERTGRCLLASLFILGGVAKLLVPELYRAMMVEAGLTPVAILLPVVLVLELGGGLAIALGLRIATWAALILAGHTLGTNLFVHRFSEFEGPVRQLELSAFFKNIAIIGGLLCYAAIGWRKHSSRPDSFVGAPWYLKQLHQDRETAVAMSGQAVSITRR